MKAWTDHIELGTSSPTRPDTTQIPNETHEGYSTPQGTLLETSKAHLKIVFWTFSWMTGILLYGYDFVVVGTVSSLLAFQ
jgi:hypothetical protein